MADATKTISFIPSRESQKSIIELYKVCVQSLTTDPIWRSRLRELDLAYLREQDTSKETLAAKRAIRYGKVDEFQNVAVPIVMPQVESAVTYQASVFLQGTPLIGVTSSAKYIKEARKLEALIDSQSQRGSWIREITLAFRNGFKYNFGPVEVSWENKVFPKYETDLGNSLTEAKISYDDWAGNVVRSWNPYNTFWDSRVTASRVCTDGDFIGHVTRRSVVWLKNYIAQLPNHIIGNVVRAFESGAVGDGASYSEPYYEPALYSDRTKELNQAGRGWASYFEKYSVPDSKIKYKSDYDVSTFYARIIPSSHGIDVPAKNTPQIWKFIIVNHEVILCAEHLVNAHNMIPVLVVQPTEDGLGTESKPFAASVKPIQEISQALWASIIATQRRMISDRGIFDPSRISEAHINNPNPSAKIPVRPSAYGKNLAEAYFPIPFRGESIGTMMQEAAQLNVMADKITGQNPARQGQFVKGNKTLHEYESVMANASGRDQLTAILIETQFFTPLKDIIRSNILQFQGTAVVIAKDKNSYTEVEIDPAELRKAILEFKMTDGLIPSDRVLSTEAFQAALQLFLGAPQIGSNYDISGMVSYLFETQGANIAEFAKSKEQLMYEQAMQSWQQVVMEGMKNGVSQDKLPPQPTPEKYGLIQPQQNQQQQPEQGVQ